jgi:hypothetical protein
MEVGDLSAFVEYIREFVKSEYRDGMVFISSTENWILENIKEIFEAYELTVSDINNGALTIAA